MAADDRRDAEPTSPASLRTAQRIELRRSDVFLVVTREESDSSPSLGWETCVGLADLGNVLMPPNSADDCTEAAIVVNLSALWRAVRFSLFTEDMPA